MADRKALKRQAQFAKLAEDGQYFSGVKMTLWPNGEQGEIWFSDGRQGFAISVGKGKAGLGLRVHRFAGTPPLTVSGNRAGDYEVLPQVDAQEVSITQYFGDERSQWFKRWCGLDRDVRQAEDTESYNKGRQQAAADKADNCMTCLGEVTNKAWLAGYYAEMAGLHDKSS